jgi:hypothetical protein
VLIPLAGYVVARALLARRSSRGRSALAAIAVAAAAVALWLRPIARETARSTRTGRARSGRSRTTRASSTCSRRRATASRRSCRAGSGAIAVMALFAVPLAVFGARRRWGAFVLGGFARVLALVLVPTLFMHFADACSISQARRVAGFVPFPFAVAGGGAVLARLLSVGALFVGLGAGIAFQLAYPGDFGYTLGEGGPARRPGSRSSAAAALVVAIFLPRRFGELDRMGPIAAARRRSRSCRSRCTASRHWDEKPVRTPGLTPGSCGACAPRCREGGRLLGRHDQLRDRGIRPGVRRQRPAGSRRRHEGEPALRAARRRRAFVRTGEPGDPAPLRRDLDRGRPRAATPSSGSTCAAPTRTANTRSTAARLDAVNTRAAAGARRATRGRDRRPPVHGSLRRGALGRLARGHAGFVRESEAVAAEAGPAPKKKTDSSSGASAR